MTLVWRSAIRFPTVMVITDSTQNSGCQTSSFPAKAMNTSASSATNPAVLLATDRKAVIGVGAPSYVSGAHVWNGTAETLKANPMITNSTPTVTTGTDETPVAKASRMSTSTVEPVTPKTSDIP